MFVKICGLRTAADVTCAVEAGADAVGFVLCKSPRDVGRAEAAELAAGVPDEVLTVGVFKGVPVEAVRAAVAQTGIRAVQLHGSGYTQEDFAALEDLPVKLIRAISLEDGASPAVGEYGEDLLLLDSPQAGSGETWNWSALSTPDGEWLLAGGLSPANVAEAVAAVKPWGVDVSSGVESSRGVKDQGLIRAFLAAARS
ncbi:phosphoribosylanthranilate isomerase [Amycolatopsis sp. FDAARGOS 1241]|uniref:phosphoribosylanthranilate isomerase n=1 Tax=Amycolatopsis sp. FDAARGOS 1241 TaxID=2778070 RepID=UPI0019513B9A|nr:phosphoribosylanthranilate isomerase [Amycolatopsis sp. FDAARGOS 1241]QRP47080.1 phosphoribosylanthranilate isomerase [Amycolatopsis sp. FDAARGOS 1241]